MSHWLNLPPPLTRLNPFYPGQWGTPGTWNKTGLRQTCEGAIFYVDPNFPGVSDARDGTDPSDPLETVQAAIDKCSPYRGDTIFVMAANSYQYTSPAFAPDRLLPIREAVLADVPGIRIVGVAPSNALGVTWFCPDDQDNAISITAPDVLVEGFSFTASDNDKTAIAAYWDGIATWGDAPVIRNCYFGSLLYAGIYCAWVYNAVIYNNEFRIGEAGGRCIVTDDGVDSSAYFLIKGNQFNTSQRAIFCNELNYSNIQENSIYNPICAIGDPGITSYGIDLAGGNQNMVFNNWFSCILPVPLPGDWDDFNTAGTSDAWVGNHVMNGLAITNPT